MQFDIKCFNELTKSKPYEGIDAYLIDDNKNEIPYHIYMCLIESDNLCALYVKKIPTDNEEYQIYEFNGNKLLAHNSVRLKELSNTTGKYERLIKQFENKEFQFEQK